MMSPFLFIGIISSNVLLTLQRPSTSVLPKPVLQSNTSLGNGYLWTWLPVTSDEADPVLGYKLIAWVMEKSRTYTKTEQIGDEVVISEYKDVDYDKFGEVPDYEPAFVTYVYGADATSARVYGTEPGVYYQFRVQAYSAAGDGPLSDPISIRRGPTITN